MSHAAPPIPPLRPSEQFALKILREERAGGATDRRWLIGLMLSRSTRWRPSTFAMSLVRLSRSGYVKRWKAGRVSFYVLSPRGMAAAKGLWGKSNETT